MRNERLGALQPPHAVLYRVSTDSQDHARQIGTVEPWLAENGIEVPERLRFNDTISRTLSKGGKIFEGIIKLVEAGKIKTLLVEKFDRFGVANVSEWFYWAYRFQVAGCQIYSISDDLIVTDEDCATQIRTFFMAEGSKEEQEKISSRSVGGKIAKLQAGQPLGQLPSWGLDKVCTDAKGETVWRLHYISRSEAIQVIYENGKQVKRLKRSGQRAMPRAAKTEKLTYIPSEDEFRVQSIKDCFRWYLSESIGAYGIAKRLNRLGRKFYNRGFTHEIVRRILRNPIYCGRYMHFRLVSATFFEKRQGRPQPVDKKIRQQVERLKKRIIRPNAPEEVVVIENFCEPLVDVATWESVQKKLNEQDAGQRKTFAPRSDDCWLQGLLVCGDCGGTLYARHARRDYACQTYVKAASCGISLMTGDKRRCYHNNVNHEEAERAVSEHLRKFKLVIDCPPSEWRKVVKDVAELHRMRDEVVAIYKEQVAFYVQTMRKSFGMDDLDDFEEPESFFEVLDSLDDDDYLNEIRQRLAKAERTRQVRARAKLDQIEKEHEVWTRALGRAASERQRAVSHQKLAELEAELLRFESQALPFMERSREAADRCLEFSRQVEEAIKTFGGSENRQKREMLDRMFSKIVVHIEHRKTKKTVRKVGVAKFEFVEKQPAAKTNDSSPSPNHESCAFVPT